MHLHQVLGQHQAETGPAELASKRTVDLLKGLKDTLDILWLDANSCVGHRYLDVAIVDYPLDGYCAALGVNFAALLSSRKSR